MRFVVAGAKVLFFLKKIDELSRSTKQITLFTLDLALILVSLLTALALQSGMVAPLASVGADWALFPIMLAFGALTVWALRLSRIKIRTVDNHAVLRLATAAVVLATCAIVVSFLINLSAPRTVALIFGVTFFMSAITVHFFGRYTFELIRELKSERIPVAIYGAGSAGQQLAAALGQNGHNKPVCFIDDNEQLHGTVVGGLKVEPARCLRRLIKKHGIKRLLLAMPSAPSYRRTEIMRALSTQPIEVMELPNLSDEVGNKSIKLSLRAKRRQDADIHLKLSERNPEVLRVCQGKTVFIAGAGGALGTQLARQIIRFEPAKVVLFERSDAALLKVMHDVSEVVTRTNARIEVVAKTGSVGVLGRVRHLVKSEDVDIIINAAHYGNSTLAASNIIDLVSSNVLGPVNLTKAAIENGVERLVLLSSERVTSPKDSIDQTQMLAEKLVMGIARNSEKTKVAMLRFGQTSGSPGDIMPLLERQVCTHNTVTLADPDMTRFFFNAKQATDLILSALPHADAIHNKPVHLSKGEPQRVMDFVEKAIERTGKGMRSEDNPFGVEVKFCGLRPGESVHERCPYQSRCKPFSNNSDLLMSNGSEACSVNHSFLMNSFSAALVQYDEDALNHLLANSFSEVALHKIQQTA